MLRLRTEYPEAGFTNTIFFCLQPESSGSTRVYTRLLRDDLGGDAGRMAESARLEQAILDEDLALQEQFAVPGLPLRPEDEVSMRADAAGVALRRVLAAFVRRAEGLARSPIVPGAGPVATIAPA
jgi:vanillate O-demethylase monooxygenase subunit